MNTDLTNPQQPTAPQTGKLALTATDDQRIDRIANAFSQALEQATATPTSYNNPDLPSWQDGPSIGTTPPVDQPGRPSMSKAATNISGVMIASTYPILALGAAATGVMWGSGYADPTVIGYICATPVGLAIPILALSRLVKRTKETVQAAPPVIHQHYTGTVVQDQRQVNTTTRGLIANTRNQLPK